MTEATLDRSSLAEMGFSADSIGQVVRLAEASALRQKSGPCLHPIRLALRSRSLVDKRTGEIILSDVRPADLADDGIVNVACGNRRESVCPSCSRLYKFDAYNLVAAGLRGGKDVPESVSTHPRLFVTLTAPSFGPVHLGPDKTGQTRPCHPRRKRGPLSCGRWHQASDPLIGTPLDPATYDYVRHVVFNAMASALWSRTTIEIRRALAELAGIPRRDLANFLKLAFAKVAEYQVRGSVHFHAVIRLDGPDGPDSTPPAWATVELLTRAVALGIERASLTSPDSSALGSWTIAWGTPDLRPIGTTDLDADSLSDTAVARYVAKYATKSAETAGIELPPLACRACSGTGRLGGSATDLVMPGCRVCLGTGTTVNLADFDLTAHARALVQTCWRLGALPELAELKLRTWAHMLGFRGHFATKSRAYSTTFGALRAERSDYAARTGDAALDDSDDDTVIVVNHWAYAGRDDFAVVGGRPPDDWDETDPLDVAAIWEEVNSHEHDAA